ncbi:MAG: FHA domain-containing protein, partial [Armatimonadota bacterium]|nr:FHA domain-containing protein [Armatimonadota bacterium]
ELKFGNSILVLAIPETSSGGTEEAQALEGDETAGEVETIQEESQASEERLDEVAFEQPKPVARLVVVSDPTKVFDIKPGENDIGRRGSAAIPITFDRYVSSIHADLTAESDGFYITDMGSTNGTFVNGVKIVPGLRSAISDGDEITVGMTKLRFEILSSENNSVCSDTQSELPEDEE